MTTTSRVQRSAGGRAFAPDTSRLINLAPGTRYVVARTPEAIRDERRRMGSRIRTAALATGRRYRIYTEDGKLYAECVAA